MKFKRLISMFLSLAMIISCLTAMPIVAQAATGFTNFVENGDMESAWVDNRWVKSSAIENPTIGFVADTDTANPGNTVLRFDGTTTTSGTISYMRYSTKLAANKTYYYSYKVRLAASDVNDTATTPLYLYTDLNSNTGTTARPKLSKDWVSREGTIKTTGEVNASFKVCNTDQSSSGSANVKSVIFELDDVVIYDLTNAKTITLPADATIANTDSVLTVGGKNYAMAGSTVSVTYEKDGYTLTADTADITKNGNTYTFTVGSSNVTVSEIDDTPATEFTNFVENGDMESAWVDNRWVKSSAIENPTIGFVADTDTANAGNTVLRFDGTTTTSGTLSYMRYSTKLAAGTKYYYSYKVRLAENDTNDTTATPLYLYTDLNVKTGTTARPELSKEWATRSGTITPTQETNISFKVCNSDQSSSGNANVKSVIYEIDDVIVYDLTAAKAITLPEGATITSTDAVVTAGDTSYALIGSEVTFTYAKDGYTLSAEGAELTQNGNEYTFTVDATAVTITEVKEAVTEFENLIADPGFDGTLDAKWSMNTYATGDKKIVTDTKDATNKVLRVDFTENTKNISYIEYQNLPAGTYYMSCKIRLADNNEADTAYVYVNRLGGVDHIYWDAVRPAVTKGEWSECYGVFTKTAAQNIGFKIIASQGNSNDNISKAIYEIDDFKVYDLASASNIAVPTGVEFTSDNVVKSHDNTYYAINGNDVAFTYGGEGLEALYINGEEAAAIEGTYSHTVEADTLVLAVANQANEDTVKYAYTAGTPYAIFTEDATVTLIVAGHSDEGVLNSMNVAVIAGTAGEILDLSTVEEFEAISGWANKTVFTWEGVATLNPIRGKCVLKDL